MIRLISGIEIAPLLDNPWIVVTVAETPWALFSLRLRRGLTAFFGGNWEWLRFGHYGDFGRPLPDAVLWEEQEGDRVERIRIEPLREAPFSESGGKMPYRARGRWVQKKGRKGWTNFKRHPTARAAKDHARALNSNVHHSAGK